MQARLVNQAGVYMLDLDTDSPPKSIEHGGMRYRLLGYDDPAWSGAYAIYAHDAVDNKTAIQKATAND